MSLDTKSTVPIFQQIVDGIERWILAGSLKPGDFLPSVREFAVTHKVNPNTVAKAYQVLQADGLVETIRGKGLAVSPIREKRVSARKEEILREKALELIAVRKELHVSAAELQSLLQSLEKETP